MECHDAADKLKGVKIAILSHNDGRVRVSEEYDHQLINWIAQRTREPTPENQILSQSGPLP